MEEENLNEEMAIMIREIIRVADATRKKEVNEGGGRSGREEKC